MIRWLTLGLGMGLLAGCVSPSYPSYPTPLYLPPPYVVQPYIEPPRAGPVPLFPTPDPRPEPLPAPEALDNPSLEVEPPPLPETETATPSPAPVENPITPPRRQAVPGNEAPLQGFRPMRGQTRPGI